MKKQPRLLFLSLYIILNKGGDKMNDQIIKYLEALKNIIEANDMEDLIDLVQSMNYNDVDAIQNIINELK